MSQTELITAFNASTTPEELFDLLHQGAVAEGYDKLALFAITPEAADASRSLASRYFPIVMSNYGEDVLERLIGGSKFKYDPILPLTPFTLEPIPWPNLASPLPTRYVDDRDAETPPLAQLFSLHGMDIFNEITSPLHGENGDIFAMRYTKNKDRHYTFGTMEKIHILAIYFHRKLMQFISDEFHEKVPKHGLADHRPPFLTEIPKFSQREEEVLLWTAKGKSAASIGIILGLSENTINFYTKKAMAKLQTTNRVIAVVRAVHLGLIQP